ncbi:MAG: carboxymuconolactone decarboxylase family protein [Candidatus Eisenbacteria bacterium]|nr:carboxymuconolactone decarboxylase family protein [Candidatus Eisenbacteria bacterium]
MTDRIRRFREERERLNQHVLSRGTLGMRRFFALDHQVYKDGALDARTKELLGLATSTVLRCDDCILYHMLRCTEEGVTDEEITEALEIALVVGGSIVIPHLRRAIDHLGQIRERA